MGVVLKFDVTKRRPVAPVVNDTAIIEYMYAPEIDAEHPYAIRIECSNPENGIWLSREEYIALIADLVDTLNEEAIE